MFEHHIFSGIGGIFREPFVIVVHYEEWPVRVDTVGTEAMADVDSGQGVCKLELGARLH